MLDVTLFAAFLAGVVSFLAPCVVPLYPVFISFITGISISDLKSEQSAQSYLGKILFNTLLYILGFSTMFVLLGLSATSLGRSFIQNKESLNQTAGFLLILFGLYTLGLFNKLTFTQKQFRIPLSKNLMGLKVIGPILMGVTFALAWSPCAGAILGAILTLAANAQSVERGGMLLFVYSLGISLPFLLTALTISRSYKFIRLLDGKLRFLSLASGVLLILFGVLMVFGRFDLFSGFFLSKLYRIPGYMNVVNSL
jgi:cytochrome c-type biogenesis protein